MDALPVQDVRCEAPHGGLAQFPLADGLPYPLLAEGGHLRKRPAGLLPLLLLLQVDDDLPAEELAVDLRVEVVRHLPEEGALRERLNLAHRHQLLLGEGDLEALVVVGHGLASLLAELPSEHLRHLLCRPAVHLAGDDVAHGVEDDVGVLLAVVADELRLVLSSEHHGHLVASRRRDERVQSLDDDRRGLVQEDGALEVAAAVDELEERSEDECHRRAVGRLVARVVAHADDLRLLPVADVQREVIPGEHPVEGR